jgi:hypothetical protein
MSQFADMTSDVNSKYSCFNKKCSAILYQGKYDKNVPSGYAAFKLWNFTLNTAPKEGIVSKTYAILKISKFLTLLTKSLLDYYSQLGSLSRRWTRRKPC